MERCVYVDYAAATPLDDRVAAVMHHDEQDFYANPSALHTPGIAAATELQKLRARLAKQLQVTSEELIFTGSGTEADNLALLGAARANKKHGNHIIISSIEHKAIFEVAAALEREGFRISYAPVTRDGFVTPAAIEQVLTPQTILVSVMLVNNEVGTIQPISEIHNVLRTKKGSSFIPLLHVDACQGATTLSIKPTQLGVDLLTLNGAKIYGPKGTGLLYVKKGVAVEPLVWGGGQEWGLRAGTESLMQIAGFVEAFVLVQRNAVRENKRLKLLVDEFRSHVQKLVPSCVINTPADSVVPSILNVAFPGIEGESLVLELDAQGIYCSTGSACASKDLTPSHVLLAMGKSAKNAQSSIRFSFGKETTSEDLEYVLSVLPKAIERLAVIAGNYGN